MKKNNQDKITVEDITWLYNELNISFQSDDFSKFGSSYPAITNRNFGTKDYTISSNNSEQTQEYVFCSSKA